MGAEDPDRPTGLNEHGLVIAQRRERLDREAKSRRTSKGAVSLDGRLIDYASIRQAEVLVKKAEQIAAAG